MKEEHLVKLLLIVGIVCLSVITISDIIISKFISSFAARSIPHILCQKDTQKNYILAKPTHPSLCDKISDILDIAKPEFCDAYTREQKNACLELIKIAERRSVDCLSIFFGKTITSVNPEDVMRYCEIMGVT
jgi:hypothetical protein